MVALFNRLKKDGDVTYLSLVVPDEDSVHFYIDAMVEEMGDDPLVITMLCVEYKAKMERA